MLLSAVSVLVVAQRSSEVPEGLMNNPVFKADEYRLFKKCINHLSGFGGLEVACYPLVLKFAGSHPAEAKKNPQHAFLRRGSKAVSPMS
jgi:hypothetical protein